MARGWMGRLEPTSVPERVIFERLRALIEEKPDERCAFLEAVPPVRDRLRSRPSILPGLRVSDRIGSARSGGQTGRANAAWRLSDPRSAERGGMGRVYRAEQRALGRTVAVKVIHPHLLADENSIVRF